MAASTVVYTFLQCSPASVGLAQALPNKYSYDTESEVILTSNRETKIRMRVT